MGIEHKIPTIQVHDELNEAYILYGVSVVASRALPDVRDGLKPVHRHILQIMFHNYPSTSSYKKSARAVGDIMGRLHPHGDSAIYEAMIKMAQPWFMSSPLIDIQGNKGSVDGDDPAAMRYTEAKVEKFAEHALDDLKRLDPARPDMIPNYDGSEKKPAVMPFVYPNIIVNGGSGIAVGMASSFAPHNLSEVINATLAMIDNPDITLTEIMKIIPGPDFPTGCKILGRDKIREVYETGSGAIPMEAEASVEVINKKDVIVIKSLPFQVIKFELLSKIGEIVRDPNDDRLDGISDIKDLSKGSDVNIRIFVRNNVDANVVLNKLKRHTRLSCNFNANMTCIHNKQAGCLGLMDILKSFIQFRTETIYDRTEYQQDQIRNNINREVAYWITRRNIDKFTEVIKKSSDRQEAIKNIMAFGYNTKDDTKFHNLLQKVDPDRVVPDMFYPSAFQAGILVDQKMSFLTGLELEKIEKSIKENTDKLLETEAILSNPERLKEVMKEEMTALLTRFGKPRKCKIEDYAPGSVTDLDLIEEKQVLVLMTQNGYIKLANTDDLRDQKRGGRGKIGMQTRDDDYVRMAISCSNKDNLLIFTEMGMSYALPAYMIEMGSLNSKGKFIANYLENMEPNDKVTNIIVEPKEGENKSIIFVTNQGSVRRNDADSFRNMNIRGKIAMKLEKDMRIVSVFIADESQDVVMYSSDNKAVRFQIAEDVIRTMNSRNSTGIRGMILGKGASVLGAMAIPHVEMDSQKREAWRNGGKAIVKGENGDIEVVLTDAEMQEYKEKESLIITITEDGYGKRFSSHDLNVTNRGCRGVAVGPDKKKLLLCRCASPDESIAIITDSGQTIRMKSDTIRMTKSRIALGTLLLRVDTGTRIVDCSVIINDDEEE